ncbi:hypothetical protein SUDANB1_00433 [Streptomyces sp. enrichment culture]|uniref:hypothetical protein n=1 Tax=Streptomyces sp. enrichment culture TaxID=1795815 RepID=UPI003F547753
MTFRYRDRDNDLLTASPGQDRDGRPVLLLATTPDGVDIPLDRLEELVAGLRDTARQAAAGGPPPQHLGNGANAEDCPACHGTNPPYPFICPGDAS